MYRLHYRPDSASSIIRLVLEELGQPYSLCLIDKATGNQDSAAYRALQPLGLVPALETPDGPMFETAAILLWLSERHGALAPLPGTPARAAFLKWLFFTANTVHPTLLQLFYPHRAAGEAAATAVLAHAAARMQTCLALLDAMVAQDAPDWLDPQTPSILGYYLAMLMRWMNDLDAEQIRGVASSATPALHHLLVAYEARPAARRVAVAENLGDTLFSAP